LIQLSKQSPLGPRSGTQDSDHEDDQHCIMRSGDLSGQLSDWTHSETVHDWVTVGKQEADTTSPQHTADSCGTTCPRRNPAFIGNVL